MWDGEFEDDGGHDQVILASWDQTSPSQLKLRLGL